MSPTYNSFWDDGKFLEKYDILLNLIFDELWWPCYWLEWKYDWSNFDKLLQAIKCPLPHLSPLVSGIKVGVEITPTTTMVHHARRHTMAWVKQTFTCLDEQPCQNYKEYWYMLRTEYAIQAWSPYLIKDILKLERVQRLQSGSGYKNLSAGAS